MKKEFFYKNIEKLNIQKDKWIFLDSIERIELNDGRIISPNWKYDRFYIGKNETVYIKNGICKHYGGRLPYYYNYRIGANFVQFFSSKLVEGNQFYSENEIEYPRQGFFIRCTDGNNVIGESVIEKVEHFSDNTIIVKMAGPIRYRNGVKFSFYNPFEYERDKCDHSSLFEGIYTKFEENSGKLKRKDTGIYHDVIKIKDIKAIVIKLENHKTFKIEEDEIDNKGKSK